MRFTEAAGANLITSVSAGIYLIRLPNPIRILLSRQPAGGGEIMAWLALLAGVVVGAASGLVGIGGGVLLIPIFVYGFKMNQHTAQGTSLGALLAPIGLLRFMEYYRAGNVNVKVAVFVALGFALGIYFGGAWAQHLPESTLRRSFAVLLALTAFRMFFQQ